MARWYPDYQTRDYELVDYQRFYVDGCDVPFRGPPFNPFTAAPGSFFTCLGSVQTYGACYERPYPVLLAESLQLPALNLAVGGAGPGFYTLYDRLIEAVNRGRFVILQCMAARHAGNTRFDPDGFVEFVIDRRTGESIPSWQGWKRVLLEEPEKLVRYLEESRRRWVEISLDLLRRIKVPVVFFYFSRRPPDYEIDFAAIDAQAQKLRQGLDDGGPFVEGLMGDFPHLVDGGSVREVAAACQAYVECLSARGMGQRFVSRFTGRPVTELYHHALGAEFTKLPVMTNNFYYPSAEMHEDARDLLAPEIRRMLRATG